MQCSEPLSFPGISCGMLARAHAIIPLVSFSDYYTGTRSRSQSVTDIYIDTNGAEHSRISCLALRCSAIIQSIYNIAYNRT